MKQGKKVKFYWGMAFVGSLLGVLSSNPLETEASNMLGGPSHLGTFEGSTTFTTSSSNGINPGLYLEVMDEYGNYHEYTSEEGVITVPHTQEGAYVTQAKLLGKTKYRDQDTGELLDQWEDGRKLILESVENPGLETVGKNLISELPEFAANGITISKTDNPNEVVVNGVATDTADYYIADVRDKNVNIFNIPYGDSLTLSNNLNQKCYFGGDKNGITEWSSPSLTKKMGYTNFRGFIRFEKGDSFNNEIMSVQIEKGEVVTPYKPYQSNLLTVNEEVELRGIGEVRDTLDLITGEVTERIGKVIFDGSDDEDWKIGNNNSNDISSLFYIKVNNAVGGEGSFVTNDFKVINGFTPEHGTDGLFIDSHSDLDVRISNSKLSNISVAGFKEYLNKNPLTVCYKIKQESIKTVTLNSTYYFKPVNTRAVYVDGTVVPLVCSVTVPTQPLSFVLNPNEEPGKQFIAPEFTIENNNPASLSVSLKEFKQVTTVFNDVLPSQHADWSQLDQEQSKDLALALVPKVSDGWKQLKEGPRYVVDSTNDEIGEIKPKSSVDFTFSASHGPAFTQALSPRYRLVFVFDF